MTPHIAARAHQHRSGAGSDVCKRYGLKRLVYVEVHHSIVDAIARGKALKAWKRARKLNLIGKANPEWRDLFDELH